MERGKYGEPIGGQESFKDRMKTKERQQAGDLPPDKDEHGKMINPHNPDFITKVPWYLGPSGPTLTHQNAQKNDHELTMTEQDRYVPRYYTYVISSHPLPGPKLNRKLTSTPFLTPPLTSLIRSKEAKTLALRMKGSSAISAGFRKGACKNCGAMTHKEKDCVERPRSKKKTARAQDRTLAADEATLDLAQHGKVSYAAKRDQWRGYDASQYSQVVDKFKVMEDERRAKVEADRAAKKKQKQNQKQNHGEKYKGGKDDGGDSDFSTDSSDDEAEVEDGDVADEDVRLADAKAAGFQSRTARQGGVGGAQMKTTVSNLRIREDVPKYLRNLDLDSAFYDPKTRSMRSNPNPEMDPNDVAFAGDNFLRHTGDAVKLAQSQVLCWDMKKGGEGWAQGLDPISNPSASEFVHKKVEERASMVANAKKNALVAAYGTSDDSGVNNDTKSGSSSSSSSSNSNSMSSSSSSNSSSSSIKAHSAASLDPRLLLGSSEAYREYSADGRIVKGAGAGGLVNAVVRRTKYDEDVFPGNHSSVWGSYYDKTTHKWGYACCHAMTHNAYCVGKAGWAEGGHFTGSVLNAAKGAQPSQTGEDVEKKKSTLSSKKHPLAGADGMDEETMEAYRQKRSRADDPMDNISSDTVLDLP